MIFKAESCDVKDIKLIEAQKKMLITTDACQKEIASLWGVKNNMYLYVVHCFYITDKNFIIVAAQDSKHSQFYILLTDEDAASFLATAIEAFDLTLERFNKELCKKKQEVIGCEQKIDDHKNQIELIKNINIGVSSQTKTTPPPEIKLPAR